MPPPDGRQDNPPSHPKVVGLMHPPGSTTPLARSSPGVGAGGRSKVVVSSAIAGAGSSSHSPAPSLSGRSTPGRTGAQITSPASTTSFRPSLRNTPSSTSLGSTASASSVGPGAPSGHQRPDSTDQLSGGEQSMEPPPVGAGGLKIRAKLTRGVVSPTTTKSASSSSSTTPTLARSQSYRSAASGSTPGMEDPRPLSRSAARSHTQPRPEALTEPRAIRARITPSSSSTGVSQLGVAISSPKTPTPTTRPASMTARPRPHIPTSQSHTPTSRPDRSAASGSGSARRTASPTKPRSSSPALALPSHVFSPAYANASAPSSPAHVTAPSLGLLPVMGSGHQSASTSPVGQQAALPQAGTARAKARKTLPYNPLAWPPSLPPPPVSPTLRSVPLPTLTPRASHRGSTSKEADELGARLRHVVDLSEATRTDTWGADDGGLDMVGRIGLGIDGLHVDRSSIGATGGAEEGEGYKEAGRPLQLVYEPPEAQLGQDQGEDETAGMVRKTSRLGASTSSTDAGDGEEDVLGLEPEEAIINRKIADLEISNASLLAINRTLEATKAKQRNEILRLRRALRTSLPPISASPHHFPSSVPPLVSPGPSLFSPNSPVMGDDVDPLISGGWEEAEEWKDPELEGRWERVVGLVEGLRERAERAVEKEVRRGGEGGGKVLSWVEMEGQDKGRSERKDVFGKGVGPRQEEGGEEEWKNRGIISRETTPYDDEERADKGDDEQVTGIVGRHEAAKDGEG